jgi:pimeloyl-ACP methyl ester carboxylesterase
VNRASTLIQIATSILKSFGGFVELETSMANFVLIHGGIQGGWVWKRVVALLRAAGHEAYAPTLTGCGERTHLLTRDVGLETHVQDVVNVLEYEDLRDVILVGHSYGGTVATVVSDRVRARISHLVIVDGAQPLPGQSMLDSWSKDDPQGVKELDRYVQETGDGWLVVPMHPSEFGVTDEDDIRWLEKMDTPHPYKTFQDSAQYDLERVSSLPQTIIICIGNQPPPVEPPAWAKGKRYRTIASGHAVNVIAPKELTTLLLECA